MKFLRKIPLILIFILPSALVANPGPHWWYEYEVLTTDPADDYVVVNQGQLKHMASKAYEYLLDYLPGDPQDVQEALEDIEDLIDSWSSPGRGVDDYQAINLGQLKNVACLFYDVLIGEEFESSYPWGSGRGGSEADDYTAANIGQLKHVFNFDIVYPVNVELSSSLIVSVSQEAASGYLQWVHEYNIPAGQDGFHDEPANDGIPNLFKYAMGMDPFDPTSSWASMPVGEFIEYDGIEYFAKTFDRPVGERPDLQYVLEVSHNLNQGFHFGQEPVTLTDEDCVENPDPGDFECDLEDLEEGFERVWMFDAADPDPTSEHPFYFTRILINILDDSESSVLYLVGSEPNMKIWDVSYFGRVEMHSRFQGGFDAGLGIDEGRVISTGIAANWNKHNHIQNIKRGGPGDRDLEEWMFAEGFNEYEPDPEDHPTADAAGIEIEFEPEISGNFKLAFLFASDEYYEPFHAGYPAHNDGMAVFLFELDSEGGIIPSTRRNIAKLPDAETSSRAINVFNIGELLDSEQCVNLNYFKKNSQYSGHYGHSSECSGLADLPAECDHPNVSLSPCKVGYSGFTPRLTAEGQVEAGKRYLMKAVVADQHDDWFDSAIFIEDGSLSVTE